LNAASRDWTQVNVKGRAMQGCEELAQDGIRAAQLQQVRRARECSAPAGMLPLLRGDPASLLGRASSSSDFGAAVFKKTASGHALIGSRFAVMLQHACLPFM
jgi:hypothetical protein